MKKDQVVILEKRGVILVSGEDSKDFLQNIITNDINKVSNKNSISVSYTHLRAHET